MGKVAIAEMKRKRKKKKGRPPKAQIPLIAPRNPIILDSPPITYSRSHRRNPKFYNISLRDRDADAEDDDDDERKEKKVKLVVRLPQSDEKETPKINQNQEKDSAHSASEPEPEPASESEPDSGSAFEDRDAKKRKINAVDRGSEGAVSAQVGVNPALIAPNFENLGIRELGESFSL